MIGTTNGLSQKTAWSEQNNEIIFQLPRGLYVDRQEGTVVIRGQLIQNKERYAFNFYCLLLLIYVQYTLIWFILF